MDFKKNSENSMYNESKYVADIVQLNITFLHNKKSRIFSFMWKFNWFFLSCCFMRETDSRMCRFHAWRERERKRAVWFRLGAPWEERIHFSIEIDIWMDVSLWVAWMYLNREKWQGTVFSGVISPPNTQTVHFRKWQKFQIEPNSNRKSIILPNPFENGSIL